MVEPTTIDASEITTSAHESEATGIPTNDTSNGSVEPFHNEPSPKRLKLEHKADVQLDVRDSDSPQKVLSDEDNTNDLEESTRDENLKISVGVDNGVCLPVEEKLKCSKCFTRLGRKCKFCTIAKDRLRIQCYNVQ